MKDDKVTFVLNGRYAVTQFHVEHEVGEDFVRKAAPKLARIILANGGVDVQTQFSHKYNAYETVATAIFGTKPRKLP